MKPRTKRRAQAVSSKEAYQRKFADSDALCRYVADRMQTVFISFSGGKDAIGSWIQMRRYFKTIIPFHLEMIPGVRFAEDSIRYYEDVFQTRIYRYPHPSFFRMLRNLVFQPPERCALIESLELPKFTYDDIEYDLRRKLNLPDAFVGVGNRASDSMVRRTNIRKFGALNPNRLHFLPVFDWSTERLMPEIRTAKVRLSVEYKMFGRSFDGLTHLWLQGVQTYFPEDYQRILEWFPLAHLEFARRRIKPEGGAT